MAFRPSTAAASSETVSLEPYPSGWSSLTLAKRLLILHRGNVPEEFQLDTVSTLKSVDRKSPGTSEPAEGVWRRGVIRSVSAFAGMWRPVLREREPWVRPRFMA